MNMIIIGHRGAAGLADENTISSLKKAEKFSVDMAEFDLRQTKDGEIVVMHDATLFRTHRDRRRVTQVSLSELRRIAVKENRPIPTLVELLTAAQLGLNLEVKESGFEKKLVARLRKFPYKVLISSPLPGVLKKIRALDEKLPLGLVIGPKVGYFFRTALKIAEPLKLSFICPYHILVNAKNMERMKKINVKVYAWTVNDEHEAKVLREFGVDGLFTDYPNLITK